jgi:hypothetical protein
MQYKPIENCHMENTILGKDFNLGMSSSLFHAFTPKGLGPMLGIYLIFGKTIVLILLKLVIFLKT